MVKKILLIIIFISFNLLRGQEEDITYGILPSDVPTSNLIKYNRFYFNPTFSLVRENKKSINAYTKMQWASFNDNPQTFLLSYTSNFDERIGVSIGLHQQNEGIYNYFGGIANFAYAIELNREMNFTFGMNLGFSQSGLKPNIDSTENMFQNNNVTIDDPIIFNYQNSSVFQLSPGVNFNYEEFDAGISVSNLVAYNLSSSTVLTDKMAFTGHVMYTTSLERRSDKTIRGMAYANMLPDAGSGSILRYGANGIVELPDLGWGQVGYNSFYGISLGIGGYISSGVSIGYTYEMGFGDTSEFGGSHEVGLAYNFETEAPRRRSSSKSKTGTQKAYEARDSEIRRLKKEILDQNRLIRELQDQTGELKSNEQRAMNELERSIAEAKEKESQAARDLELQREEEVKLLNRKKAEEEERLRSQSRLEAEMAEQKLEEERLRAQSRLEVEMTEQRIEQERLAAEKRLEEERAEAEQKAAEEQIAAEEAAREEEAAQQQQQEEERIAAEEARREEEAAQQQQEEERIAEQAAQQQEEEEKRAEAQRKIEEEQAKQKEEEERLAAEKELEIQLAEQKAEEERLASQKRLEVEMAEQKAEEERLASQKRLEVEMAEQKAEEERLASQKSLEVEMSTQVDEAAEAARLA
ncbi:PorP/SprF family type IX secretion system membrane protein, partial [Aquimarina pacifica]|uniref:PorP/SprF family type IX secretion system membrane protein n=1 Tax=Aquimarina pacifica TaxID=1296415 RepID=UPI00046F2489